MQTIIYYANDEKIGKGEKKDFQGYREWAKRVISEKYPKADLAISTDDCYHVVRGFETKQRPNGDAEVVEFLVSLLDACKWDWNQN